MYRVFPRLSTAETWVHIDMLRNQSESDRRQMTKLEHPGLFYAQGPRVSLERLAVIRDVVREEVGPLIDRGVADASFDRLLGAILFRELDMTPYEASVKEVWNYFSSVVLPEIAPWRFPNWTKDRMEGRPLRNALARTWWRAYLLGPDLAVGDSGAEPLGENELYALIERTTIGMNKTLVRACAEAIYGYQKTSKNRDTFVEEFSKEVLKRLPSRHIGSLQGASLTSELRSIVALVSSRT